MSRLLILIGLGLGFAFLSIQNSQPVTVNLQLYTFRNVPLYVVIGSSLFFGILLSWIIAWIGSFFTYLTLNKKDHAIKDAKDKIHDMTKKVNELEIENARLKGKLEKDDLQEESI